jgi:hypothetical protein
MATQEQIENFKQALRDNATAIDPDFQNYQQLFIKFHPLIRSMDWTSIFEIIETELFKLKYDLK